MCTRFAFVSAALALFASIASGQTLTHISQDAYIKASNSEADDNFGRALALSGDTLVVGAPFESSAATGVGGNQADNFALASGAAYVFRRTPQGWVQEAYLKASNTGPWDLFGTSVAIFGDTIVIGAPGEDSGASGVGGNQTSNSLAQSGAAYVFKRSGTTWTQQAYLKASNPDGDDVFGESVAVSGDRVVVGAPQESSLPGLPGSNSLKDSGAVYEFLRVGTTWNSGALIKASNAGAGDSFGEAVALDGMLAVVGAPRESSAAASTPLDDSAQSAGAAYVFLAGVSSWTQAAYLKAQVADPYDWFGAAVAISGQRLVIGAPFEDSNASGVNGDQTNNDWNESGAAFIFDHVAKTWSQSAYLKLNQADPVSSGPYFGAPFLGISVAIDGDMVLLGASGDLGTGRGVNSNPLFSAPAYGEVGAAAIYERNGGTWSFGAYLKASNPWEGNQFGSAVAVSNGNVVAGDWKEGSSGAYKSGSVYSFDLAPTWGAFRYGAYAGANTGDLNSQDSPEVGGTVGLDLAYFFEPGLALVLISAAPAEVPMLGGKLLVDMGLSVLGSGGVFSTTVMNSWGQLSLPISPGAAGLSFFAQAAVGDPSQVEGIALSNGLEVIVKP